MSSKFGVLPTTQMTSRADVSHAATDFATGGGLYDAARPSPTKHAAADRERIGTWIWKEAPIDPVATHSVRWPV